MKLFSKLIFIGTVLLPIMAKAQATFEVDGIVYMEDLSDSSKMAVVVRPKRTPRTGEESIYSGDIIVPKKINYDLDTYDVIGIARGAFYSDRLNSLIIEDGVSFIDDHAIYSKSLKKLRLPGSVKEIRWITTPNLEEIEFGYGIESVGELKFGPVRSIKFPDSLKRIYGISISESIDAYENFSIEFGKNIEELNYCLRFFPGQTLKIPHSCKKIENSFMDCMYLKSLELGDGLELINESFGKVNSLKYLEISKGMQEINKSFTEVKDLRNIKIQEGIKSFKDSFLAIPCLAELTLPNSLENIVNSFQYYNRYYNEDDNSSLSIVHFGLGYNDISSFLPKIDSRFKEIYCPWQNIPSTPKFDYDFYHGREILKLFVPKDKVEQYEYLWNLKGWKGIEIIGFFDSKDCSKSQIKLKKERPDIKSLPSAVTYAGIKYQFLNENELTIEDADSTIEDEIIIPNLINFNGFDYYVIGIEPGVFKGLKIISVDLPNDLEYIQRGVFENCTKLETVKFKGDKLKTIGPEAFSGCKKLKNIELSESLLTLGIGSFSYCDQLENIKISKIREIPDYCFVECMNLSKVELSEGVEIIGEGAFLSNTQLKEIDLPLSLKEIKDFAFANCIDLVKIKLPKDVKISETAFYESPNVEIVYK